MIVGNCLTLKKIEGDESAQKKDSDSCYHSNFPLCLHSTSLIPIFPFYISGLLSLLHVKIMIKKLALGLVPFFCMLGSLQIASPLITFLSFKGNKCCNWSAQRFKVCLNRLIDFLFDAGNFIILTRCDVLTSSLKLFHHLAVVESKTDVSNFKVHI